jgi:3'-phosphoadenosine 5'-phosphosulfate sulfotransferase (PAPS reductase)/FAD synthetase
VETHAAHFGVRFVVVKRQQGDLLQHVERYGKWPTPSTRYCTADHKRQQIHRAFTALVAERGNAAGPARILNCVGLRAEESPGRAKRPALVRDRRSSSGRKVVDVWLPIHGWSEAEVWDTCRATGAPMHPAYAAGLPRASCVFCIFAPEDALRIAGQHNPELLAEYVRVEQAIGHTFKRHLPIAKVAADLAAGVRPARVASWRM